MVCGMQYNYSSSVGNKCHGSNPWYPLVLLLYHIIIYYIKVAAISALLKMFIPPFTWCQPDLTGLSPGAQIWFPPQPIFLAHSWSQPLAKGFFGRAENGGYMTTSLNGHFDTTIWYNLMIENEMLGCPIFRQPKLWDINIFNLSN